MDRTEVEEVIEPADYRVVAHQQVDAQAKAKHPDVEKRRRDLREGLGWPDARLNELAAMMAPDDYLGIAGAEAIEVVGPRGVTRMWFPRFEPAPAPPAPDPMPEVHRCYYLVPCAGGCGRLHRVPLGAPLP